MSSFDVSRGVCALVPGLQHWLENAFYSVRIVDAQSPREKDSRRVLLATEIGHATHRDILISLIDGAPSLVAAANGLPARVAFGLEDISEVGVVRREVGKLILVVIVLENGTLLLADVLDFISATFHKQINMIWMISFSFLNEKFRMMCMIFSNPS